MSSAAPMPQSHRPAVGLPEGVHLAPMGRRFVAYLIDAVIPELLFWFGVLNLALGGSAWLTVVLWVLAVLCVLVLLWMYGQLAAGPGMRLMHLQVVGVRNGRPIGIVRALIRGVLLALITDSVILLIIMVVLMWRQPRRQGWHDLVADSVVIEERPLAPARAGEIRDPRVLFNALLARFRPTRQASPRALEPSQAPQYPPVSQPEYQQPQYQPEYQPQYQSHGEPPQYQSPDQPQPQVPQQYQPQPQRAAEPQPVDEPQPTPAPTPSGWAVVMDDGREVAINRLTLFGRNPQPRPGEDDAQLIKVVDEARTVSKTHIAINVDPRGVFVTDRGSTNGSAVTDPQGVYNLIAAGRPVRLGGEGYVISFGNHHLRLIRH